MSKTEKKIYKIVALIYLLMFGFKHIVLADGLSCESWGATKQDLQNIFDFAKIIVPLLVVGVSSYDFIKAITSKDAKDIKKAFTLLIKRFAYAIIFFFLPVFLNFLLELFDTNAKICVE